MNEEGKKSLDPTARFVTILFLVGLGHLLFATFRPYLSALIWSAVLSYGLYPQYCKIPALTGQRQSLSAFLMSLGGDDRFCASFGLPLISDGKEPGSTYLNLVYLLNRRPGLIDEWLAYLWVLGLVEQVQEFQRMTGMDRRSVLGGNLAELGGATKLHMLLTFFAVVGGIRFFGLVGIVAGPLFVAVSFALVDSYGAQKSAVVVPGAEP
jgi:hypothetical protein